MSKLRYEKYNNADNVITIDLHNGYTIIAVSGYDKIQHCFTTTLFLKENTVDRWDLIEKADNLQFHANNATIHSAILKTVGTMLEEGFFDYYMQRYEYELMCFDKGNELMEAKRLSNDQ